MKNRIDAAQFFDAPIDPIVQAYVDMSVDIALQVEKQLKEKGWTNREFAKQMGKNEAEVSKWLSGIHNLTLKSIAKMKVALGSDIVVTPQIAKKEYGTIKFIPIRVHAKSNTKHISTKFLYVEESIESQSIKFRIA